MGAAPSLGGYSFDPNTDRYSTNPQPMAAGGQIKGYAAGGMPPTYEEYLAQLGGKMTLDLKPWQQGKYAGMNPKDAYETFVKSPEAQPTPITNTFYGMPPSGVSGLGGLANQTMPSSSFAPQPFAQASMQSTLPGGISFQESNFGKNTNTYPGTNATNIDGKYEIKKLGSGGLSLGGYSDGGRMLKGPGDGMSDSIPGIIGNKQPARLADGEFVVPADVVSHLGNGSTDAGAKRLYAMMDQVRKARTGNKKQGKQIKAQKYLPA
jgi:hypothetical protein